MKKYTKPKKNSSALVGLGFVEIISLPHLGFLRGVNRYRKSWQLTNS